MDKSQITIEVKLYCFFNQAVVNFIIVTDAGNKVECETTAYKKLHFTGKINYEIRHRKEGHNLVMINLLKMSLHYYSRFIFAYIYMN